MASDGAQPRIIVALGSQSEIKMNALRNACIYNGECRVKGISAQLVFADVDSGEDAQPVGFENTYRGAYTRACNVREKFPEAHLCIGIENGIITQRYFIIGNRGDHQQNFVTIDMAVVVVRNRTGVVSIGTSRGVQFPQQCVNEAQFRGFKTTTVGSVVAEVFGGNTGDPHVVVTYGRLTRLQLLTEAIGDALSQATLKV